MIRSLIAIASFGLCSLSMASKTIPEFKITTNGEPAISIELASSLEIFPGKLSLKHKLTFDGMKYASRIIVPELLFILRQIGASEYSWYYNGIYKHGISNGEPFKMLGSTWLLSKASDGSIIISDTDGHRTFSYAPGSWLPKTIKSGDDTYRIISKGINIIRIEKITETAAPPASIHLHYDTKGLIQRITVAACIIEFEFNEELELIKCRAPSNGIMTGFKYDSGLLTAISINSDEISYQWSDQPSVKVLSEIICQPFVIDDGIYKYSYTITPLGLSVKFKDPKGKSGRWTLKTQTNFK